MPDRSQLRPEIRAYLEASDGPPIDMDALDLVVERQRGLEQLRPILGEAEPVARVEETSFRSDGHEIPVRIYRPAGARGTVLFFHGGGWVFGSLDTHDNSCRMLANRARCAVVSIEYRKAPEHPFPAAVRDCLAGLIWLKGAAKSLGLDASRLVICGESAGGNLAAVTARHARDRGIPLAGQALIYPVVSAVMDTASYRHFADGFFLSAAAMRWYVDHYASQSEFDHPDVSPIAATDLRGLAPAFVATVDHDPLRDEGRAYAAALVLAGNDLTFHEVAGAVHGVWVMAGISPASAELIGVAAKWLRETIDG